MESIPILTIQIFLPTRAIYLPLPHCAFSLFSSSLLFLLTWVAAHAAADVSIPCLACCFRHSLGVVYVIWMKRYALVGERSKEQYEELQKRKRGESNIVLHFPQKGKSPSACYHLKFVSLTQRDSGKERLEPTLSLSLFLYLLYYTHLYHTHCWLAENVIRAS